MTKKATVKHKLFWRMAQATLGFRLLLKYRTIVTWHAKPPKDSGYLLVANHANRNDPFLIGHHLRTPINYMANVDGVTGFNKVMSSGLGCFNIKKGRPDSQAFVSAMNILKQGYSVGIFVEGDRSWFGETKEFSTAAVSLAKKMGVPILMAKVTGHYIARPRWSDVARKGRILVDFDLIKAEEVKRLSRDEIRDKIANHIQNNDFTDERLKSIRFSGKNLAVGVKNILWKCPHCNADDSIVGKENIITCKACGSKFDIDAKQNISDAEGILAKNDLHTIQDWCKWEIKLATEFINKTPEGVILRDTQVELFNEPRENEWNSLGKGTLEMTKEAIVWHGKEDIVFDKADILNIVDNFNVFSLLNLKRERYKVVLHSTSSFKWERFLEIMMKETGEYN